MKRIATSLVIDARREDVWRALTDFGAYPEWNRLLPKVEGAAALGARLDLTIAVPDGARRIVRLPARIVDFAPGRSLAWIGGLWPVFRGRHWFRLKPARQGTLLEHGEDMAGVYPLFLGQAYLEALRGAYAAMNSGIAARVEAARAAPSSATAEPELLPC